MKLAGQVTDFLWHRARLKLQSGQKEVRTTHNTVTVLGDVTLPSKVHEILEKGPKYSFDPGAQRHQLLAIARRAATCPGITDEDRATSDAFLNVPDEIIFEEPRVVVKLAGVLVVAVDVLLLTSMQLNHLWIVNVGSADASHSCGPPDLSYTSALL
ncbi:hypothetical protein HPB50_003721 [Hyalomma asiaticum]|uniref:Uncharacterized protein n=1 Tax=Hyalomma asiaticum TaxID=266040 RepID=A0ACB7SBX6_HYAAI|nr:hypothetical protein HPB50_003721 [Hyalomma asiaticum]